MEGGSSSPETATGSIIPEPKDLDLNLSRAMRFHIKSLVKSNDVDEIERGKEIFRKAREAFGDRFRDDERRVIELRYDVEGKPRTLNDVGKEMGRSRNRIWQIEQRVMRKILSSDLTLTILEKQDLDAVEKLRAELDQRSLKQS